MGTHPLDFVHPDEVGAYRRVLDDLTGGRASRALTSQRYRHRDGHWVWVEISFSLTHDRATGAPDGYVATLRDVSARKAAEDALRLSEARYPRPGRRAAAARLDRQHGDRRRLLRQPALRGLLRPDRPDARRPDRPDASRRHGADGAAVVGGARPPARPTRSRAACSGTTAPTAGTRSCSCRSGRARAWWACSAPPSTSTRSSPPGAPWRTPAACCTSPSRPPMPGRGTSTSTAAGSSGPPRARGSTASRPTGTTPSTPGTGSP
ncbi:MAG: PAS domain S-box protein [Methylobacterium radiotolerans]